MPSVVEWIKKLQNKVHNPQVNYDLCVTCGSQEAICRVSRDRTPYVRSGENEGHDMKVVCKLSVSRNDYQYGRLVLLILGQELIVEDLRRSL